MDSIKNIAILGTGTMGIDLALLAAIHGFDVLLWHRHDKDIAQGRLNKRLDKYVGKSILSGNQRDLVLNGILAIDQLDKLLGMDLVIETIAEDYVEKTSLIDRVAEIVSDKCIITSNTSSFSIDALAEKSGVGKRFAGMHFFNPALKQELVEIIAGSKTPPGIIAELQAVATKMGKTPVLVKDAPGFIVNRLMACQIKEAVEMVADNIASCEDIDTAMKLGLGHPIGPLALADLIGLDVMLSIYESLHDGTGSDAYTPPGMLKDLVAKREFGRKSGKGFFNYD